MAGWHIDRKFIDDITYANDMVKAGLRITVDKPFGDDHEQEAVSAAERLTITLFEYSLDYDLDSAVRALQPKNEYKNDEIIPFWTQYAQAVLALAYPDEAATDQGRELIGQVKARIRDGHSEYHAIHAHRHGKNTIICSTGIHT